jgi:hypothetical protein
LAQDRAIVSLGLHSTVLQAEYYAIKACITENMEKGYTGKNIYSLPDSQAAIKAIDIVLINSKLVRDCRQSLVKVAEHNSIQLVLNLNILLISTFHIELVYFMSRSL